MSALGQKQTYAVQNGMSALPPESGHVRCTSACPLSAKSELMQCSKEDRYSITSLARASSEGGTVMPSTFAVLRLMTSSSLGLCARNQTMRN